MNTELIVTLAAYWALIITTIITLSYYTNKKKKDFLTNDLSRDSKRWSLVELEVAAYVGIFEDDDVRLNTIYRVALGAVLKRSDRAVSEKIRRLSTVGSLKSDASEVDQDTAYYIASMSADDAKALFLGNIEELGGSVELMIELSSK